MKNKINVKLLRRIKNRIIRTPREFYMGCFEGSFDCRTVRCIAGWACYLSKKKWTRETTSLRDSWYEKTAQELLGLTDDQATALFCSLHWPKEFRELPVRLDTTKETAKMAGKRIEYFIKYKK